MARENPMARLTPEAEAIAQKFIAEDKKHGRRTSRAQAVHLILLEWAEMKREARKAEKVGA